MAELKDRFPNFRPVVNFKPVPNARTLASEFERRIQERGAVFDLVRQTISLTEESKLTEPEMVALAREIFNERHEPADEARTGNPVVDLDIDESGRIKATEQERQEQEPQGPTYQEKFTELMQMKLPAIKDIAREFPRSREFGGWSGKSKTDLIVWVLRRRGFEQ